MIFVIGPPKRRNLKMDLNKMKSNLIMKSLYFKEFNFSREEKITDGELSVELKKNIETVSQHNYNIVLELNINNESNDINLHVVTIGNFEFDSDDYSAEEAIINKNTVAIMFPYIRSHITLMTSQPNMNPIILPPINFSDI